MALSRNALGNLANRYRAVLKKCRLINTFGALLLADCSAGSVSLTRGRVVPSVGQRFTPGATRYGLRPITLPVDIFGSSPEDVHRRKSALDAALLVDPVELYLPSGFAYTASLESISDPTELDVEGTILEVAYTLSGFAHTPLETILVQAGTPLPDPDPGGEEPPPTGTLSSLAVGSVIQLAENGTAADYYVAAHNYESGLNGTGRTLVVRKDCLSAMAWNRTYLNAYAQSTVDTWLTSVFLARFATDVRAAIGSTRFCYMPGSQDTTVTTLQRSVFLLSLAELGLTFSDTPAPSGPAPRCPAAPPPSCAGTKPVPARSTSAPHSCPSGRPSPCRPPSRWTAHRCRPLPKPSRRRRRSRRLPRCIPSSSPAPRPPWSAP